MLEFYAAQSPIFMAARFDANAAKERNQEEGEGTPIHLTIPLENPWVPLRILGLGKARRGDHRRQRLPADPRQAEPAAAPDNGLFLERSEQASKSLLDDLRSDKGMEWVPDRMWFSYLRVGEQSGRLRYDLAIDKSGDAAPSAVMAGLEAPPPPRRRRPSSTPTTAAPTSTTAKPKPKPRPTPTTAAPPRRRRPRSSTRRCR